jgi:hypothetical protein
MGRNLEDREEQLFVVCPCWFDTFWVILMKHIWRHLHARHSLASVYPTVGPTRSRLVYVPYYVPVEHVAASGASSSLEEATPVQ